MAKEKHAGGRPPKFKSKEQLQKAIDAYFKKCRENKGQFVTKTGQVIKDVSMPILPTIAGLAYHLKVERQTIYNYEEKDQFFDTITRARDYILSMIENKLANVDGNISGTVFLAQNYGYRTNSKTEHSGNIGTDTDEEMLDKKINELLDKRKKDK